MNLEIYEPVDTPEPIRLAFEEAANGDIYVIAVDKNGEEINSGYLIRFRKDGTIHPCIATSDKLGFQLNDDGQIKVS